MKILLIGASGTIGQAIEKALSSRHQIVRVGKTKGEFQVDIASADSIKQLYERIAPFDAVVCAAGSARFAPLDKLKDEDFTVSLANKLMGQVNIVRYGTDRINDRGSFQPRERPAGGVCPRRGAGINTLTNFASIGSQKARAFWVGMNQEYRNRVIKAKVDSALDLKRFAHGPRSQ